MITQSESMPLERFVAIDIHKEYVAVGALDAQLDIVLQPRRVRMDRFGTWIQKHLRPSDAVVIEATTNSWHIYDQVAPLVGQTVVAHPPEVKLIAHARVKTDRRDVIVLARLLAAGLIPEVWVPPQPVRELRALISHRWRLSKMSVMTQNRLHSVLHRHNLVPPKGKLFSQQNHTWWQAQAFCPSERLRVQQDLSTLAHLKAQIEEVNQELGRLSTQDPWASQAALLLQIPGLGLILTMTTLAAIGDIARFDHAKKLVGYAGLGAGVHDSGKKHREGHITKRGRKELRWAMVEAAWQAVRSNEYWKAQFTDLKRRKHPNAAIVAIARKLLVTIWHVLSKQECYRYASEEDLAFKFLMWSWSLDEDQREGLTRQQFVRYHLLRLGIGNDLTRIERNGYPRRIAGVEEVLALRPDLKLPH